MTSAENFLERGLGRVLTPLENFIHKQTTAGILLFVATVISISLANSPWKRFADAVAHTRLGVVFNNFQVVLSLHEWISSGLMALFFFLIGLELKREMLAGKLRDIRQVTPILMAALGGMVLPALIYWAISGGGEAAHGWAIPAATDTAFALAALALFVKRSSPGIAVFLAALAIFDDIGAVIVVGLFYTRHLDQTYLIQAIFPFLALVVLNLAGVRRGSVYSVFGIILWWCIHESGVHATVAGLLMALTIPARTQLGQSGFTEKMRAALSVFERKLDFRSRILESTEQHSLAMNIERTVKSAVTPLQRWHSLLLNPVGIVVLPLFALLNAGIDLSGGSVSAALSSPVTHGVTAGLALGKPLGIILLTLAALKLRIGVLPEGMSWRDVVAAGLLSGIGFTMSLFITALSFQHQPDLIEPAKLGIIAGSLLSAIAAFIWLRTAGYRDIPGTARS